MTDRRSILVFAHTPSRYSISGLLPYQGIQHNALLNNVRINSLLLGVHNDFAPDLPFEDVSTCLLQDGQPSFPFGELRGLYKILL